MVLVVRESHLCLFILLQPNQLWLWNQLQKQKLFKITLGICMKCYQAMVT
uniref:Uncharacterized protein n=1 Tax=Arundo donax TaxID=35708 RepID=A0A0A9EKW1_ARUDO